MEEFAINLKESEKTTKSLGEKLLSLIDKTNIVDTAFDFLGKTISKALNKMDEVDSLDGSISSVRDSWASIFQKMEDNSINGMANIIQIIDENLQKLNFASFKEMALGLSVFIEQTFGFIAQTIELAFSSIENIINTDIFQELVGNIMSVSSTLVDVLGPSFESIKEIGGIFWEVLKQIGATIADSLNPVFALCGQILTEVVAPIINIIFESLKVLAETLASAVLPVLDRFSQALKDHIVPNAEKLIEVFKENFLPVFKEIGTFLQEYVFPIFGKIAELVGTALVDAFVLLSAIAVPIFKVLGVVFTELWNIFKPILENLCLSISGIITVCQGVLDFIVGIFTGDWERAWEGVKEIFTGALDTILGIFGTNTEELKQTLISWAEETTAKLDEWTNGGYTKFVEWWDQTKLGFSEWAIETLQGLADWYAQSKEGFSTWFEDTKSKLGDWWNETKSGFGDWYDGTIELLGKWLAGEDVDWDAWWNDTTQRFGNWWSETKEGFSKWKDETAEKFSAWINDTVSGVKTWSENTGKKFLEWKDETVKRFTDWASETKEKIVSWTTDTWEKFSRWKDRISEINWLELGKTIVRRILDGLGDLCSRAWESVKGSLDTVKANVKNMDWMQLGKDIINGIINGINSLGSQIAQTLMGFARDAISNVKKVLGIASPSKVFKQIFEYVGEGALIGVEKTMPKTIKTMDLYTKNIVDDAQKIEPVFESLNDLTVRQNANLKSIGTLNMNITSTKVDATEVFAESQHKLFDMIDLYLGGV